MPASHSKRMLRRTANALALALVLAIAAMAEENPAPQPRLPGEQSSKGRYTQVTVDPTKTSIYIGSVSLTMPPFQRRNGLYTTDYAAKAFPFFFYSERGQIAIEFSDENLRQLQRGETAYFKGHASNSAGAERRIEGRAVPDTGGADHGKIKVRVWVGKVELIFNSVYRFTGVE